MSVSSGLVRRDPVSPAQPTSSKVWRAFACARRVSFVGFISVHMLGGLLDILLSAWMCTKHVDLISMNCRAMTLCPEYGRRSPTR